MSNKKKPVGMALDITTGKSYKVYQPEPVSEQIPPEFEWIKPGVRVLWLTQTFNVVSKPFLMRSAILDQDIWWVKLQRAKYAKRFSVPVSAISLEPITLTLTRDQSQGIVDILTDVLHYGPSEDLEWLKKQIEEKLK